MYHIAILTNVLQNETSFPINFMNSVPYRCGFQKSLYSTVEKFGDLNFILISNLLKVFDFTYHRLLIAKITHTHTFSTLIV